MLYRGFRDFRTEDIALATDLRRWNQVLEETFAAMERELATRPRVVKVFDATHQAQHGEFILAGYNQDTTVFLPLSSPDTAGRKVEVVNVANVINVIAQSEQKVSGQDSYQITGGFGVGKTFKDDGMGGFWVME